MGRTACHIASVSYTHLDVYKRQVQALSGGNQQKVVIAKWIETEPKILILNSPTVGVDVGSKADIHAYARKLAGQGMGVIIISDDISEVLQNCNRVFVMNRGRIDVYKRQYINIIY